MKVHDLKCYSQYYDAIICGSKKFEIRVDDRDYRVSDVLHLIRWCESFTGDHCLVKVLYVHRIDGDRVVMSISDPIALEANTSYAFGCMRGPARIDTLVQHYLQMESPP